MRVRPVVLDGARVLLLGIHRLVDWHAARRRNGSEHLASSTEHWCAGAQVDHPAHDHVAISRAYLAAVPGAAKYMRGRHRRSAPHERVVHHVARIAVRLQEELHQRAGKRRGVRALRRLRLHLDHVAGARDAGMPALRIGGGTQVVVTPAPGILIRAAVGRGAARPGAQQPAPGGRLRIVGRVVEAVLRLVPDRLRPEFDLLLAAEMEHWFKAFLNRFPQPPGTPLSVLRQQNSSTNRQPHWRL